jgi:hypothetical protein
MLSYREDCFGEFCSYYGRDQIFRIKQKTFHGCTGCLHARTAILVHDKKEFGSSPHAWRVHDRISKTLKNNIPSKTLGNSYWVMNRQIWTNENFLSRTGQCAGGRLKSHANYVVTEKYNAFTV